MQVGIGLAVLQQITGINAIIYYADEIFPAAGFTTPSAQTMATTWAVGAVNVAATFIAIAFIDRLGRRKLLLAGLRADQAAPAELSVAIPCAGPIAGVDIARWLTP